MLLIGCLQHRFSSFLVAILCQFPCSIHSSNSKACHSPHNYFHHIPSQFFNLPLLFFFDAIFPYLNQDLLNFPTQQQYPFFLFVISSFCFTVSIYLTCMSWRTRKEKNGLTMTPLVSSTLLDKIFCQRRREKRYQ
jgi:hypothetical protein